MKEQFFRPLECATADGVTVGHSVTLVHIAHMLVIICHNLRLYSFSSSIAEITFCWGTEYSSKCKRLSCPATILSSSQPWFLRKCLLFSVLLCSVLGVVACLSCLAWHCHNSKSVSWLSHQITMEKKKLSIYNLWPRSFIYLVSSVTVAWVAVKCCAMCCLSFPKYTFMSYVYPVESQSLKILMLKCLRFFGVYCLKITLLLKETITSSIARFLEGL